MTEYLTYIFLGMVQGLTEFLPVSSSGHLVIFQTLFGMEGPQLFFDIMLHVGTGIAVIFFLRKDLAAILGGIASWFGDYRRKGGLIDSLLSHESTRMVILLFIACIPTGLAGILLKDTFEGLFHSVTTTGLALIITGFILFLTRWAPQKNRGVRDMNILDALIVGLAQGIAITPGISRSGFTICALLFLGINRELSAKFSFLLALPAITGAAILESSHINRFSPGMLIPVGSGFLTSILFGFLALYLLLAIVRKGKMSMFAYYCWILGTVTLFYGLYT